MNNKEFIDDCFNTLYRLVKSSPAKIDRPIIDVFQQFIPHDPVKSFIILNNYYDQYCDVNQDIQDPYYMLELLFLQFRYFIVSNISINFMKLVIYIYLNEESKFTRECTTDEFIQNIINSLSNKKVNYETLCLLYQLLTILNMNNFYKIEKIDIDDSIISSHLGDNNVKKDVLNFLFICSIKLGPKTVNKLSGLNHSLPFYILLQFARSKNDHTSLVVSSNWLVKNPKKIILQMRIFLALLIDTKCRKKLSRLRLTMEYLQFLVDKKLEGILKLTSTCARRLIYPESLDNFQKSHFFPKYWEAIKTLDQSSLSSCIMSIDKLVETGYIDDLNDILSDMSFVINSDGPSSAQAIKIISKASKYPQCKPSLKKYIKYFAKLKETGDFQNEIQFFEKNINK